MKLKYLGILNISVNGVASDTTIEWAQSHDGY